jgi:hypothetical protein
MNIDSIYGKCCGPVLSADKAFLLPLLHPMRLPPQHPEVDLAQHRKVQLSSNAHAEEIMRQDLCSAALEPLTKRLPRVVMPFYAYEPSSIEQCPTNSSYRKYAMSAASYSSRNPPQSLEATAVFQSALWAVIAITSHSYPGATIVKLQTHGSLYCHLKIYRYPQNLVPLIFGRVNTGRSIHQSTRIIGMIIAQDSGSGYGAVYCTVSNSQLVTIGRAIENQGNQF